MDGHHTAPLEARPKNESVLGRRSSVYGAHMPLTHVVKLTLISSIRFERLWACHTQIAILVKPYNLNFAPLCKARIERISRIHTIPSKLRRIDHGARVTYSFEPNGFAC